MSTFHITGVILHQFSSRDRKPVAYLVWCYTVIALLPVFFFFGDKGDLLPFFKETSFFSDAHFDASCTLEFKNSVNFVLNF